MGLILDSSILIAAERGGESVREILKRVQAGYGETEAGLSAVTIVELTHGIYRAKNDADSERRRGFVEEICRDMVVHPVTLEIAQLAGRIEGEQAARGVSIAFEDLLIGATALHLGHSVATLNARHFRLIPSLSVIQLWTENLISLVTSVPRPLESTPNDIVRFQFEEPDTNAARLKTASAGHPKFKTARGLGRPSRGFLRE
jgi:tRNA(fMet)-specific endonuclease VapC